MAPVPANWPYGSGHFLWPSFGILSQSYRYDHRALDIAAPLTLLVLILALAALISLRFTLRMLTGSLQNLATEAGRIAQGQLDHPLQVEGVDEVGQLRRAFDVQRHHGRDLVRQLRREFEGQALRRGGGLDFRTTRE